MERYVRAKEVISMVGVSRATLWRMCGAYRFPQSFKVSRGVTAWRLSEINQFLDMGPDTWFEQVGSSLKAADETVRGVAA